MARPAANDTPLKSSPFEHSPYPFGMPLVNFPEKEPEENWAETAADDYGAQGYEEPVEEEPYEFKEHSLLHSKLLLFEHDDHLRVCVATANLRQGAWDFHSEAVWIRDFPRKAAVGLSANSERSWQRDALLSVFRDPFARMLAHYIAMLLRSSPQRRERWLRRILQFDFSAANAHLVAS